MSGIASPSGQGFAMDMQKTLKSIATDIQRANPGATPQVMMAAVQNRIEMMKGLEPEQRALMQSEVGEMKVRMEGQIAAQKAQNAMELAQVRAESAQKIADIRAQAAKDVEAARASAQKSVAGTRAGATIGAAGIRAGAQEAVAGTNAGARRYAADKSLEGAKVRGFSAENVAKTGAEGRVRSATVSAGGKDPGGPGGAQNPVSVKTPQDAQKLPKGTYFKRPDGTVMVRQ
jgi:hypothetical protein